MDINKYCAIVGCSPNDLIGRSRLTRTSNLRHIYVYVMYAYTGMSLDDIAESIGRVYHTVLHSVKVTENMISVGDRFYIDTIDKVKSHIDDKNGVKSGEVYIMIGQGDGTLSRVVFPEFYMEYLSSIIRNNMSDLKIEGKFVEI